MGWMIEQLGVDSRQEPQIFRLSKASRKAGVHTATNQNGYRELFPGDKVPELECAKLHCHFLVLKQRYNCIFIYTSRRSHNNTPSYIIRTLFNGSYHQKQNTAATRHQHHLVHTVSLSSARSQFKYNCLYRTVQVRSIHIQDNRDISVPQGAINC